MTRDQVIERQHEIEEAIFLILSCPLGLREIVVEGLQRSIDMEASGRARAIMDNVQRKLVNE